jgi:DeoR/GlpR family transcriptional regulator of sugar metabolism
MSLEANMNERQRQIVDLLTRYGEVRIHDLKERFPVTEMTLRRDLEKLEQLGLMKRTFGGAISVTQSIQERAVRQMDEKLRIGRAAAAAIREGESVFIDGGTTTLQIARHLPAGFAVTVVTNALNVAAALLERRIRTIVLGGMALESTSTLVGPLAVEAIGKMAFDRIFLGATGVSARHGFSNSDLYEAELKRAAIRRAAEVNVTADHTKFGEQVLVSFASLGQVHRLFTDRRPDEGLQRACEEAGLEIVVC